MQTETDAHVAATGSRKPLRDMRGFWRILLAAIAPLPMLSMGLHHILNPTNGDASFTDIVAAYAKADSIDVVRYLGMPFLVGLIPATFAVAWVSRRGAPRLATIGAVLALLGDLAGFPLIRGGDELAYVTVKNGFDVATMNKLQDVMENDPVSLVASLLFIVGIVFGLLLLGLALWRSGAAPAWMGLALALGGFTHPFMPGHVASGIGLFVAAIGFGGASVALLRMRNDEFDLPPLTAPVG